METQPTNKKRGRGRPKKAANATPQTETVLIGTPDREPIAATTDPAERPQTETVLIGTPDREPIAATTDPAERLRTMAARRVPNAVKAIQLCGNIANYKPSESQRKAIIKALRVAVDQVETRFDVASGKTGITFILPE